MPQYCFKLTSQVSEDYVVEASTQDEAEKKLRSLISNGKGFELFVEDLSGNLEWSYDEDFKLSYMGQCIPESNLKDPLYPRNKRGDSVYRYHPHMFSTPS